MLNIKAPCFDVGCFFIWNGSCFILTHGAKSGIIITSKQREDIKMKQFRCVFDVYYDTGAGGIYDDNGGGYVGRTELTVPAADTGSARELIEKQYKGYRIKWLSSEPV